eukprot:PITA_35526
MHYFLGMEVWQKDGEVFVSQGKYANEILRRFHMEMCKPMETPLTGNWRKEDATSVESSYGLANQVILEGGRAFAEISQRHYTVWIMVQANRWSEAPRLHGCRLGRSKHIDIRYHHLRDCGAKRIMMLLYILIEERDEDMLTKALSKGKF